MAVTRRHALHPDASEAREGTRHGTRSLVAVPQCAVPAAAAREDRAVASQEEAVHAAGRHLDASRQRCRCRRTGLRATAVTTGRSLHMHSSEGDGGLAPFRAEPEVGHECLALVLHGRPSTRPDLTLSLDQKLVMLGAAARPEARPPRRGRGRGGRQRIHR